MNHMHAITSYALQSIIATTNGWMNINKNINAIGIRKEMCQIQVTTKLLLVAKSVMIVYFNNTQNHTQ